MASGSYVWACVVWVSVIALKILKVRLYEQFKVSNSTNQEFISLKVVVHILFQVKGVFEKDLEPTLSQVRFK